MILLEVRNLKKSFFSHTSGGKSDTVCAVDDVSFCLEQGETLGIVGESGSGKSTTGKCILRLEPPDSGEILYRGERLTKSTIRKYRRNLQLIFQNPAGSLDPKMKCSAVIAEGIRVRMSKPEKASRVRELCAEVGLPEEILTRYPRELSGGQQQRIGIARALASEPELLICDEPVSSLDVSYQAKIINLLMDLKNRKGLSYLFISHDLSVIECISEKIAVMYRGRIVEYGKKEDVIYSPSHPYTRALIASVPVADPDAAQKKVYRTQDATPPKTGSACPFSARCEYARDVCLNARPPKKEVSDGHLCECHFAGEI